MSGNHPPASVLAARIEHELYSAQLLTRAAPESALDHIGKAQTLLAQLREAIQ